MQAQALFGSTYSTLHLLSQDEPKDTKIDVQYSIVKNQKLSGEEKKIIPICISYKSLLRKSQAVYMKP